MTIYVTKDKESEYRFLDWNEVIEYAKNRIKDHDIETEVLNDLNREVHVSHKTRGKK